ncbi:SDR family oxidoreductase [Companilactobacillus ginsenosidimutans]|uniref:Oxidoreductase n=1 Tax=Companilactobacillus ginsenosidimutans TaxID=1007676 RepID=A0A0H4QGC0_9LACO|nr:SDR family NAD(P)-dependent oxidoreductase [Companilactobacillus ginsenosidimutans]AKP67449.1 oxidoreductase [Companilactobacillus ginsenosidimutans]
MRLENNTILITGGTSGIGLSFALRLSEMGNKVIVVGRRQEKIDDVLSRHPKLSAIRADISKIEDVNKLTDTIESEYPNLNMVINSAGIMRQYNLFDQDLELKDLTLEMNTNFNGIVYITKSLLPVLDHQRESMIVNISSLLALVSAVDSPIYSATKAAIHMYTDALREQVRANNSNIHIVELLPPLISGTNLTTQYDNALFAKFANSPLSTLVDAGIKGMERNKTQIDVAFTKVMRLSMKIMPRTITHIWGQQTMKAYLKKYNLGFEA